jgi:hypothetical protein
LVAPDGSERELETMPLGGGCGNFNGAWWRDVAVLAPGTSVRLDRSASPPQLFCIKGERPPRIVQEGKLVLVAHYAWRAGRGTREDPGGSSRDPPADLGGMKQVPPYELVSEPVEVEVRRLFDVSARVRGRVKAGLDTPLADVIDLRVRSLSATPTQLDLGKSHLSVRHGESLQHFVIGKGRWRRSQETFELAPWAEVSLLDATRLGKERDAIPSVRFRKPGRVRVAVFFGLPTGATVVSNMVDIDVAP